MPEHSPSNSGSAWPAEILRSELSELNRAHLSGSPNPILRGRETWPNQQSERFLEELADAQAHGVTPLSPETPAFDELMKSGLRFNWAVGTDGTLKVTQSVISTEDGPMRISHAILVEGGRDVLAAGEGRAGDFLSSTTGHYKNADYVVAPVKNAFARIGISFKR